MRNLITVFQTGYRARRLGLPVTACPDYGSAVLRLAWVLGWERGASDKRPGPWPHRGGNDCLLA